MTDIALPKADYFLSRSSRNGRETRMIVSIIEKAGRSVFHQDDDTFQHSSFMRMMEVGYQQPRTIALLSDEYQASEHCIKEYNTVLADDPSNIAKRLIVLRIGRCRPSGNLRDIGYVDLVPLLDPLDAARLAHVVRVAIGVDKPLPGADYTAFVTPPKQILHPEIRAFPGFVGREDLMDKIEASLWPTSGGAGGRAMLRNSNSGLAAGVMTGLGGVGKSTLATEWAWRNRERYCGVWWLRAETETTLLDDLIALGSRLIPGLSEVADREAAAQKALEEIATQREALPWLLVYDNAEDAAVMKWTPGAGAHVLITSRTPDWWGHAAQIDVGVWPRDDAIEFLMMHARGSAEKPEETQAAAGRLADEVGCHPLALAIARAHAWGMNWGFDQYIAEYRRQVATLVEREPAKGKAVDYPRSIAATFEMGLEKAAATAPKAVMLLGICAFLAPDAIPLDLVTEDVMPAIEKGEAVAALAETGLITRETLADGTPSISVHRLVQTVMRARLNSPSPRARGEGWGEGRALDVAPAASPHPDPLPMPEESMGRGNLAALATRLVAYAFPNGERNPSDVRHWPACARLATHAQAVLEYAPDEGDTAQHTSVLAGQFALYLKSRADYAAAEPCYRRALAIDQARLGPDHPDVAVRLNNLAQLLQATNRLAEAEPLMRRALEIDEASLGPDRPNVAIRLNNLAVLLEEGFGRYEESEKLKRRAVDIFTKALGPDHPHVGLSLNNLAQLLKATNRLDEAEPMMRRVIEIDEASYGPDHPSVAIRLNNLAQLLQDTNRLDEAEPLMRRALAIDEASYGPDHPSVAIRLNNLAQLLQDTNRLDEAEPLMRRAVGILEQFRKATGHEHPRGKVFHKNLAALEAAIQAQKGGGPGEASPGPVQGHAPAAERGDGASTPSADGSSAAARPASGPWWRRFLGLK